MKQHGKGYKRPTLAFVLLILTISILAPAQARAQETSGGFLDGSIRIGYDGRTCDGSLAGSLRYNSSTSCAEYCDGAAWTCPTGGGGGGGTLMDVSAVSLGSDHNCVIKTNGTLWCWLQNNFGSHGNGTTTDSAVPVQTGTDTDWAQVSAGDDHTCAMMRGTTYKYNYL